MCSLHIYSIIIIFYCILEYIIVQFSIISIKHFSLTSYATFFRANKTNVKLLKHVTHALLRLLISEHRKKSLLLPIKVFFPYKPLKN